MNTDLIVEKIKKDGFYILKKYISNEDCISLITEIQQSRLPFNQGEGKDVRVPNYQNYSKIATKFLNDTLFLEVGKKLLGHAADTNTKRCQLGILQHQKDNSACSGGGWHVDRHTTQFKTLLYVTNVSEVNGPFAIFSPPLKSKDYPALNLPGRGNTRFSDEIAIKYKDRIKTIIGDMGDVVLVDTSNIHRGTLIDKDYRITLTNYYYDI